MATFHTTLLSLGNNVGIQVPEEVVEGFGAGKRVPVTVTVNGYSYPSTIAVMGGRYLIPVSAAIRAAASVAGGDELDVTLDHDPAPRVVEVPDDFASALDAAELRTAFDALSPSRRKEQVRAIEEAKTAQTRERRIAAAIGKLGGS